MIKLYLIHDQTIEVWERDQRRYRQLRWLDSLTHST